MLNLRSIASAAGLAVIITAGAFFYVGWYNWEFKRPPTAVYHNQYVSGDNATVTQNEPQKDRRLLIGAYGNQKQIGAVVGWMW